MLYQDNRYEIRADINPYHKNYESMLFRCRRFSATFKRNILGYRSHTAGCRHNKTCEQAQKHHPIGWCFFVCASALAIVSAGCRRLPQPTAGTLPRKRLASSATGGASALSSSPAPKKKDTHMGVFLFLEQHFCYAKVVACGRVIEREWGNPSKVPPLTRPPPCGGQECRQQNLWTIKKTPPRVVFFA